MNSTPDEALVPGPKSARSTEIRRALGSKFQKIDLAIRRFTAGPALMDWGHALPTTYDTIHITAYAAANTDAESAIGHPTLLRSPSRTSMASVSFRLRTSGPRSSPEKAWKRTVCLTIRASTTKAVAMIAIGIFALISCAQ